MGFRGGRRRRMKNERVNEKREEGKREGRKINDGEKREGRVRGKIDARSWKRKSEEACVCAAREGGDSAQALECKWGIRT